MSYMNKSLNNKGFTLVELAVSLVVIEVNSLIIGLGRLERRHPCN